MSDAPERIWHAIDRRGKILGSPDAHVMPCADVQGAYQEYICADIHAAEIATLQVRAEAAEAALAREPDGWQPIETAPKDRLIDIWLKDGVRWCDCYHDRITDTWRTSRPSGRLLTIKSQFVSHWMDAPKPPTDLAARLGVSHE